MGSEKINKRHVSVTPWFARVLLWFLPLSFLTISFFLPLSKILLLTFNTSTLTPENLQVANSVLRFTLYQAILSTLLTILLGLPSAYLFARFNFPGKSISVASSFTSLTSSTTM